MVDEQASGKDRHRSRYSNSSRGSRPGNSNGSDTHSITGCAGTETGTVTGKAGTVTIAEAADTATKCTGTETARD